jgi:hypothetical protein
MSRWPSSEGYYDFADRNIPVAVNIEEDKAVENIEAIAATSGIDVHFIGTSDLAFSLGLRGQQDHPKVQEAMANIVAAGKAHGKVLGAPAGDPDQVRKLLEQGFLFFQTRTELGLMTLGPRQILDPFGKTPKSGKSCSNPSVSVSPRITVGRNFRTRADDFLLDKLSCTKKFLTTQKKRSFIRPMV